MSEQHIEEQPYDDRHTTLDREALQRVTPPRQPENGGEELRLLDNGDHIGNDHQEPRPPRGFWEPQVPRTDMPSRVPGQNMLSQPTPEPAGFFRASGLPLADHPTAHPPYAPPDAPGLQWRAPGGYVLRDLANFPWEHNRFDPQGVSNVELRTVYAHMLEAATRLRAEMRERGMQVDL
jgi:hypothetical protein